MWHTEVSRLSSLTSVKRTSKNNNILFYLILTRVLNSYNKILTIGRIGVVFKIIVRRGFTIALWLWTSTV